MEDSLLAHISSRFTNAIENVATESLAYIIQSNITARKAFFEFLSGCNIQFDHNLYVKTQVAKNTKKINENANESKNIPDLVCDDANDVERVIIESKFWAGLTDNQPITYLERLPKEPSLLLFVAPKLRKDNLWIERKKKISDNKMKFEEVKSLNNDILLVKFEDKRLLGLTNWTALLSFMLRICETNGQHDAVSDIKQLLALCLNQDTNAFLPLHSEELASINGKRVYQYIIILQSVVDKLKSIGVITGKIKWNGVIQQGVYFGTYILIKDNDFYISISFNDWSNYPTPFWLQALKNKKDYKCSDAQEKALKELYICDPPKAFLDADKCLCIPLVSKTNADEDEVVNDLVEQICNIAKLL